MKAKYILLLSIATLTLTACVGARDKNTSNNVAVNAEDVISTEMTEVIKTEISEIEVVETESELETEETEVLEIIETEVAEPSTQIAFEDVTIQNLDEFLASEDFVFVGFNENYKCVKGDPKYEIIDGCYKGVPLKGDTPAHSWSHMVVWVSPGGVEIKINDSYVYLAMKKDIIGREDAIWTKDPDKNLEPGSEWMVESSKFAYGESDEKVFRQAHGSVDLSTLPNVSTATEKRSSFNLTDEFLDYVEQWSIYSNFKAFGTLEYNIVNALLVQDDHAYVWLEGMTKIWDIKREDDCWKITICRNLNELDWHGLLTCLKNVDPDAQSVYDTVYECLYDNVEWIVDFDIWYDIPNSNSEIMIPKDATKGEIWFYFR